MDSVTVIGEALKVLNEHGNTPIAESLICESDDAWNDGELLNQAIRQVRSKIIWTYQEGCLRSL